MLPSVKKRDDWTDYARFLLKNGPTLRRLVEEHPGWWQPLDRLLPVVTGGAITGSEPPR